MMKFILPIIFVSCCLLMLTSCWLDEDNNLVSSDGSVIVNLNSNCGVIQNNDLVNPVRSADVVNVQVLDGSTIIATDVKGSSEQLVKLHGISSVDNDRAVDIIKQSVSSNVNFVSTGCIIEIEGRGRGVLGQLFDQNGKNLNEELLRRGVSVAREDPCGGDRLKSCYESIQTATSGTATSGTGSGGGNSSVNWGKCDSTDDFVDGGGGALWKPVSESNGKIVFLLPRRYHKAPIKIFSRSGSDLNVGVERYSCCNNGNRAHFFLNKRANELSRYDPLTVKISINGKIECRSVPNAQKRYD